MKRMVAILCALVSGIAFSDDTRFHQICTKTLPEEKFVFKLYSNHAMRVCSLTEFQEQGEACENLHGGTPVWYEIVDLNGDGHFDLIMAYNPDTWRANKPYYVFLNCGNDTFVRIMDQFCSYVSSKIGVRSNGVLELTAIRAEYIENTYEDYSLQRYTLKFDTKKSQYVATPVGHKFPMTPEAEYEWVVPKVAPENFTNWEAFPILDKVFVPSFDCAKASTQAEKMICADVYLANLDNYLASNFRSVKAAIVSSDQERLIADQRAWLKQRNSCKSTECLKDIYRTRIDEICNNYSGNPVKQVQCYLAPQESL